MARRTLLFIVLFVFVLALVLRVENVLNVAQRDMLSREHGTYQHIRGIIRDRYVDEVDERDLFYGALDGMASSLDRHSTFWAPDDYDREKSSTEGHFGGLGIFISADENGVLTVDTPMVGTPAFKAGLLPGDRIVKINETSTHGMGLDQASRMIRGKPGTTVLLGIAREGVSDVLDFEIERAHIKTDSVQEATILSVPETLGARIPDKAPRVGYVRIELFQENTADDLDQAITELEAQGMQALVLDLRQNPGGLLHSAVGVCDMFLADGKIVTTRTRSPGDGGLMEEVYKAHKNGTHEKWPMAILIDGYSASASEIVSGCLRDRGRAVLVGQTSYGKGSVQTIIPVDMKDWGEAALKLTTGKYYTPNGVSIDGTGIEPDVVVPFTNEQLVNLLKARRDRRLDFNNPLKNGDAHAPVEDGGVKPGEEPGADAPKEKPFFDLQLEKAVEVLAKQLNGAAE